jgi:FtsZ-interacting cell division protein YlmF
MGKNKTFVDLEYDDAGNERELPLVEENEQEEQEKNNEYEQEEQKENNEDDEEPTASNAVKNEIEKRMELHGKLAANINSNADKAIEKMKRKHNHKRNKKTVIFEADQFVSVKISAIDHGGTQCVVIDLIHDKYRIVYEYGILNDLYGANDLEKYEGLIDFDFKKINNKVSLTTAAIAASNGRRT